MDCFLQPIVQTYPAYLRDGKHLMNTLKEIPINDHTFIVTMDFESLYTNLKQNDVIVTTKLALDNKSNLKREQKDFLLEALNLVMSNNYFWHNGTHYNQIRGVAMGAKYAPSVANLLMSQWEESYIFGSDIPEISLYKRYIEYIIILWDGTEDSLKSFLFNINNNRYGLQFTGSWDLYEQSFLDLVLMKSERFITTKTFFKETDRNSCIPTASCHHPKWLGGIPKGQLMRVRRNYDSLGEYMTQSDVVVANFSTIAETSNGNRRSNTSDA